MNAFAHPIEWWTPAPLWAATPATDTQTLKRPALLRFATDRFMEELGHVLETRPGDLKGLVARPITFRLGAPGPPTDPEPALDHLKLYQPAHGDFYLVAASLVCRIPGLPDRTVDTAAGDRISFVLRRLADGVELGWVDDPKAPQRRSWMPVADASAVAQGEELLPMFPVEFADSGHKRKLLAGFIPTASKDSFAAAGTVEPAPTLPSDTRFDTLETTIVQPLAELRAQKDEGPAAPRVETSRFLLLDLAQFLLDHLPTLWAAIEKGSAPPPGHQRAIYELLATTQADASSKWRPAVAQAWAERRDIAGESGSAPKLHVDLSATPLDPGTLREAIRKALPPTAPATPVPVAPLPVPKLDPRGEARYVLRCVYRRPQCGPLHPDVVSGPSEEFAIASFFDFDAPARDIQITLPADTSIRDLRKFQRNVRFLISDQLRSQLSRVSPLKDLGEGTVRPGEPISLGWICSFSIPIIAICALLVLYIFLSLLNIIFWWLPLVRVCLPLPLKGK